MRGVGVLPPGDVQRAARQPDVARRRLAQRGGDEGGRGHRRIRQHRAVAEEGPDALAQAGIENGHHEAQVRVELLGAQRGMEIAEIVLVQDGERPGGLHPGIEEGLLIQLRALDELHARQPGDGRPVTAAGGRQDDRDALGVPDGEFPDHPGREGVVPAHDEMTPAGLNAGKGGHARDLNQDGSKRTDKISER